MKMWFRPKRYGYGAGLPISWEGWALSAGYALAVVAVTQLGLRYMSGNNRVAFTMLSVLVLTAALIVTIRARTDGGWRWRDGED